MRKIKSKIILVILALLAVVVFMAVKNKSRGQGSEIVKEINPSIGVIQTYISTTGTVYPKNRLAVKPPVAGRVESIAVKEGEKVKDGQLLAMMSSTERAALLDAAEGQGEKVLKYWEGVYKPISLLSPIDGEVIVATIQPGQIVTTSDAIVVLSDHLIIRAEVDETDIGKIKLGQGALITLDAYPDEKINAAVEHIYYESETVNNVTVYKVDLVPQKVPAFFRSGMNATVDFKAEGRESALLLPVEAVRKEKDESYVLLKNNGSENPAKRVVKIGITDDKNYEVLSGLTAKDTVIITTKKYVFPSAASSGSNPFLPSMKKSGTSKK
jgi:macrolide-specific efflux system membrane fusion protein